MKLLKKQYIVLAILSSLIAGLGAYFIAPTLFQSVRVKEGIISFNKQLHADYIRSVFADKDSHYWLIAKGSDYDVEYMIQHQGYPQHSAAKHNLNIDIMYHQGKPAGFISYYFISPFIGKIQFLFVNKEYRGKGFAYKLLDHVVKFYTKAGVKRIELLTLQVNNNSRKLYNRYGFKEVKYYSAYTGQSFVDFELMVN